MSVSVNIVLYMDAGPETYGARPIDYVVCVHLLDALHHSVITALSDGLAGVTQEGVDAGGFLLLFAFIVYLSREGFGRSFPSSTVVTSMCDYTHELAPLN